MKYEIDPINYDKCPDFNVWIDERYVEEAGKDLSILGFTPRPSYVLHQLSYDTYEAAFADFRADQQNILKDTIFLQFPTPIAHCFYRFENGFENELQRLHFLRDTWETTIDVLHAVIIGEVRFRHLALVEPVKYKDLLSDKVADRLLTTERILELAENNGVDLECAKVLPKGVIATIRDLNQSRNAFSHSGAQSDAQAQAWIGECLEDVLDVMGDLSGLGNIKLMRYRGQHDVTTLNCELFQGHHLSRTIRRITITNTQLMAASRYFQQGQLIVLCGEAIFSVRPLIFFHEDITGHITKVCVFRKTQGDVPNRKVLFEVIGESQRIEIDRAIFQPEIDELRALFGLPPE
jgi:hypothetical protein